MANVLPSDLFASESVASVSGLSGTGAGIGTIVAFKLIGHYSDAGGAMGGHAFDPIIVVAGLIPFVGMLLVLLLLPSSRIAQQPAREHVMNRNPLLRIASCLLLLACFADGRKPVRDTFGIIELYPGDGRAWFSKWDGPPRAFRSAIDPGDRSSTPIMERHPTRSAKACSRLAARSPACTCTTRHMPKTGAMSR